MIATMVVWVTFEVRQGLHRRPEGVRASRGSALYLRVFGIAGFAAGVFLTEKYPLGPMWIGLGCIGLVLLWCGMGLRLWSFRTLGHYFTFNVQTSADQPVITTGPYRFVRHPSYVGILLGYSGLLLLMANWWYLLCIGVAMLGGLIFRINAEEKALVTQLGDPYKAYAATHKRLVPFIW